MHAPRGRAATCVRFGSWDPRKPNREEAPSLFPWVLSQTPPPIRGGARCGRGLALRPSPSSTPGRSRGTPEVVPVSGWAQGRVPGGPIHLPNSVLQELGEKEKKKHNPFVTWRKRLSSSFSQIHRSLLKTNGCKLFKIKKNSYL